MLLKAVGTNKILFFLLFFSSVIIVFPVQSFSQETKSLPTDTPSNAMVLTRAVMCEGIQDNLAEKPTAIFSVTKGKAFCFTEFDPVLEKVNIFHHWIRKDKGVTKIKLSLNPPRWSTYSSIYLREADKGPWRVEIKDSTGNIIKTLRFSITD